MGFSQALYSGVSGLINHNRCMDNIGNNIANVNTTGFKKGVFQFSTILEQTYRGGSGVDAATGRGVTNPISLGLGTQTASIMKDFTQGPLETTNNPKHMAISGNGFFALQIDNGVALTRDGNFYIGALQVGSEKQQVLMAAGGLPVLGYRANSYGVVSDSSALESIQIEIGQVGGAHETTSVTFSGNLNSNQLVAMGTKIVGGTMTNPPEWLGTALNTADSTWPALEANAAANLPSVINGGNVMTSGALGTVAWRISNVNLAAVQGGATATSAMLERVHVSLDGSLNDNANYTYFAASSSQINADQAALLTTLNTGGTPAAAPTNGLDTNLRDVMYYDGTQWIQPFRDIANGEEVTLSWQVGADELGGIKEGAGTRTVTATFVYNNPSELPVTLDKTRSFTLEHFAAFMAGDVDSPTIVAQQDRVDAGAAGLYSGFVADYTAVPTAYTDVLVDARNRVVDSTGQFVDLAGNAVDESDAVYAVGLFTAEENAGWVVTDAGWRIDPATKEYLDDTGAGTGFFYGDDTTTNAFRQSVQLLTVNLDPDFNPNTIANQRLVGGAMGLVKIAPRVSAENGGTDPYDAPAESAGAYTRLNYEQIAYDKDDDVLRGTFNLSLVSNLGKENALSNIQITYKDNTHTNMFKADKEYFAAEGGGASTTIDVYDSLGTLHQVALRLTLVERDTNFSTWRWIADSGSDTDNVWGSDEDGDINTNAFCGTGLIRFDANGQYVPSGDYSESNGVEVTRTDNGTSNPIMIALANGAANDFVQDLNFRYLTQKDTGKPSDFGVKEQDGTAPGELTSFTVSEDGTIHGVYSNGNNLVLGRLALAMVPNENGLVAAGNNLFYEGAASGQIKIAMANTGGRGLIRQGQLETSNVDLAEEFTKLITTERGYQANARTISTVDEMLQELLNLKR